MRLELLDGLCRPGGAHNEDIWSATPQAAWIFDGATGIFPHNRFGGASEAAWLVGISDAILRRRLTVDDPDRPTAELLEVVAEEAAEAASAICDLSGVVAHELPSASLAMARLRDDKVELGNLGDCAIVWRPGEGPARRYGTSGVTRLDARLAARIAEELAAGRSMEAARAVAMPLIRRHRGLMNRPRGYWIYDLSGAGAAHVQTRTVGLKPGAELLLMTDGFYRLVDVYGRYDDESLLVAARRVGLEALYDELREIEAGDPECCAYPRGKARDDAAALRLRLA